MCSIKEAWGSDFDKQQTSDSIETFNNGSKYNDRSKYKEYLKLKKLFEDKDNEYFDNKVCTAVNLHVLKCPHCRGKMSSNIYNSIVNKIKDNADIILIILILLLFFVVIKSLFQ